MKIFTVFLIWRVTLFIVAFLAVFLIPQFGNRFPYWEELLVSTNLPPWIWGFGNFDGVHYLTIAQKAYESQYTQAFFPLYPWLLDLLSLNSYYFLSGMVLSNIFFLISLFLLYKLYKLDYSNSLSFKAVIFILAFPTAFYFGSIYSESLFLFLTVLSLLFIRRKNFLMAGIFAALSSATRIFGLLLLPVILFELVDSIKRGEIKTKMLSSVIGVILAPLGTLLYMLYLKLNFNDPLYFLTSQPIFGAERSSNSIVLLPQVLFRYIKMLFTVPINSLPYWNVVLEFSFTMLFLVVLLRSFRKIRMSYWLFTLGCLILPTLTGTLSSMPRYSLMGFLLLPFLVESTQKHFKLLVGLMVLLEVVLLSLFVRGYWVA